LGVTTVYCDTVKRARMAARLLREGGFSDVPVYAGRSEPLNKNKPLYGRPVQTDRAPHGYDTAYDGERISGEDAVEFIIRALENAPQKICIVTLGALTNIAAVFTKRPDLKEKISFLSVMGGAYDLNIGEYNFSCDPLAASIVLNSGLPIKCVGLDVTFKCKVNGSYAALLEQVEAPVIKTLMKMRKIWNGAVFLHDPLAVTCTFNDGYVGWQKRLCDVEHNASLANGQVINLSDFNWQKQPAGNLEVSVSVRADEFVDECMKRILSLK